MFVIPLGDEPNAHETPWATYALIVANVAIWLLISWPQTGQPLSLALPGALDYVDTLRHLEGLNRLEALAEGSRYDLTVFRWGYRPAAPRIETLLTCQFLHGGWLHLLGNMLFLYIFGDNVEARLGSARFVLTYLACGVVATLFFAVFRLHSPMPLVGASGAISGVLGCYFVWYPHNRVNILYSFFFFIERTVVPARVVLLVYFVMQNLLPFLFGGGGQGGTAHGAHLGGFLAGVGVALYERIAPVPSAAGARGGQRPGWPFGDVFERRPPQQAERGADLLRLGQLVGERSYAQAVAYFYALAARARRAVPADDLFALADYLTEQRRYDEACTLLHGCVSRGSDPPATLARAHLRLGLLYLRGLKRPTAAYPHLLDVLDLPADEAVQAAARQALADIEGR